MVRRVYAEKKREYAVAAKELLSEIKSYLMIDSVSGVRVLIRYDVENVSDDTFEKAKREVFSEPPVDHLYEESFETTGKSFAVEYLPGQFDQRADSAEQCIRLLSPSEDPVIRTATVYCIEGNVTDEELGRIRNHCINPVDSREAKLHKPDTLEMKFEEPEDIAVFDSFISMSDEELDKLYDSLNLAMSRKDFYFIRDYFKDEEKRDPFVTEIRVLDTYWSDHCRHTTFATELKDVEITDGCYREPIAASYEDYLKLHKNLYAGRSDKFVCLMDLATIAMKKLKQDGILTDQEESDEINACSIVVPVKIDGVTEEWLINFKNETHNHPTEIEPFGGAATCLGGAIRDPLSGRTYVYQAMRITGAADPTTPVTETMEGKLPQKKLVTGAAHGYSSYGNQIGLATGYVREIYHPGYVAKRMEIGAVMGAAKRSAVQRLTSAPGDVIVLLGGRTGRDGIGGATGSSKAHNTMSTATCGAEVQKGNPPTERKLQRLFRRPEVSHIIKKCNDFGAGGVSVAIGELAEGLLIDLDKVPKKYAGLDGTELAISESQERMAVVLTPDTVDTFLEYAHEENLEAVVVASVTDNSRLTMKWRGKTIVDLSRRFLDTNGAHQETGAVINVPEKASSVFGKILSDDTREAVHKGEFRNALIAILSNLNVCSQKGLVERFDGSIGAASVYMPFGGKYQSTPVQSMVAKLPVLSGECDAVTIMSYGFDPDLSSFSPYHGAIYACTESLSKIVAAGGDYKDCHFTFQEYFERMTEDKTRWGKPLAALLGAYRAQLEFGVAAIGGKDSMSGSFNDIDVPPTLCSFAVAVDDVNHIITPELKTVGDKLLHIAIKRDAYDIPDFIYLKKLYEVMRELNIEKKIKASYVTDGYGIMAALAQMGFGNRLGVTIDTTAVPLDLLFKEAYGEFVCEVSPDDLTTVSERLSDRGMVYQVIGRVNDTAGFVYSDETLSMDEAVKIWEKPLSGVFPQTAGAELRNFKIDIYDTKDIYICKNKVAKPKVFIPVFPGTNCEYDSAKAFERAGAEVDVRIFKNLSEADINDSIECFASEIEKACIVMFPGGFSAGDEPEGSAKFFANAFRNERLKTAINDLLSKRDGLMLGICNGFQALIKLGLVPYGEIREQDDDSPTLTYNTIGRHISHMVYLKVVSNKSPWLQKAKPGDVYVNPASHGEGRFVANDEWLSKLFANGQVASVYSSASGSVSNDPVWNVNGSYMAIEGITSADGRIYGKMAHSERIGRGVAMNIYGDQDMKLFESGVEYFS